MLEIVWKETRDFEGKDGVVLGHCSSITVVSFITHLTRNIRTEYTNGTQHIHTFPRYQNVDVGWQHVPSRVLPIELICLQTGYHIVVLGTLYVTVCILAPMKFILFSRGPSSHPFVFRFFDTARYLATRNAVVAERKGTAPPSFLDRGWYVDGFVTAVQRFEDRIFGKF